MITLKVVWWIRWPDEGGIVGRGFVGCLVGIVMEIQVAIEWSDTRMVWLVRVAKWSSVVDAVEPRVTRYR